MELSIGWVAAGLCADLPNGVAFASQFEGEDIAIWRSHSGALHAWSDRCPHRGMRLSHGFVRGETLSCIYHGWRYGNDGSCEHIPAHPDLEPPKSIKVRRFEVLEASSLIWVAASRPTAPPPDLTDMQPLRSLAFAATPSRIADALGTPMASILRGGEDQHIALAPQILSDSRTMIHALCATGTDRKLASRWLEALRDTVERQTI